MKQSDNPLPALVGGSLVVAALCTVLVRSGWLIWIPTLLALLVVGRLLTANRH
jgi:hypothetical protein